jgi:hypothetical protein
MRVSLFTIVLAMSSYALAFPGFSPPEDGDCDPIHCNTKVCRNLEILPACRDANSAKCRDLGADSGYCSDDGPSDNWRRGVEIVGRSSP